jgi:hypothetical protein
MGETNLEFQVLEVQYSAMDWVTYGKTREREKYEQCDVLLKLGVTTSKDRDGVHEEYE